MDLLFHTIALEPARWTAQRTSQELGNILPAIASAGFKRIEVFEPHLTGETTSAEIRDAFRLSGLSPEVLSSYLNLNPAATTDAQIEEGIEAIRARTDYYGFRAVRIFPGPGMKPSDEAGVAVFINRLTRMTERLAGTQILLETHDGSLADDPETITGIVRDLGAPNVGLLYQPTLFEPENALRQLTIELPFIRHVHLQNRHPDGSFAPLGKGVVPWDRVLAELGGGVTASIEFVPVGICTVEEFDLAATLAQARSEADYFGKIASA